MELPKDTSDGLSDILNKSIFNDDHFQQILESVVSYVCENPVEKFVGSSKISDAKPILTKKVFTDVACLLIEAARHNLDEESLNNVLNSIHTDEKRIKKLCEIYVQNKTAIQSQLELIGNNPPHIIDVDWHLDHCVKLNTCNSLGVPLYHVRFTTKKHETIDDVTFSCTIQQLQELVFKLKDAVRYSERLANV
ncbi:COMM domain-containing protein 3-like isoform X2 [Ceratina calcarata]|uniref:COMM domain-containing protein 3 n=1 Tax=Ceratina calcarata TaxID=156304 RepID=A0AAJ7JGG7_9HYME|nr:COMM domain-containing protein 3-like isoform X2 [Ceratina calcarata]XP_017892271.1 COMM domain-containing protein 3-like isoform X2 [Ceratina calcarata]XP_017892272.1 COMM domain-containing protein 3-like isoform X2 [Ceratina calcarata]XP_017892273.1 COMM domain-containing protein 3-like isoform X2 [Ceratina calcarata]XP_026675336.1 COMM domain-containing protein 3-like isoform X2 [Ceratina calcarata]